MGRLKTNTNCIVFFALYYYTVAYERIECH